MMGVQTAAGWTLSVADRAALVVWERSVVNQKCRIQEVFRC